MSGLLLLLFLLLQMAPMALGHNPEISLTGWGSSFCVLQRDGSAYCYGENFSGKFGVNTTEHYPYPVRMLNVRDAMDLSLGSQHACIVERDNGQVRCVGRNNEGALGDGTTTSQWVLVDNNDPILLGAKRVFASPGFHTCALLESGGVRCWGYSNFGQLGAGAPRQTITLNPVPLIGYEDAGVSDVAPGVATTCILTVEGAIKCAGLSAGSELGTALQNDALEMVQADGMESDMVAISAGTGSYCALTRFGGVLCWGNNGKGQLGIGRPSVLHSLPVTPLGLGPGTASAVTCTHGRAFVTLMDKSMVTFGNAVYFAPQPFAKGREDISQVRGGGDTICIVLRSALPNGDGEQVQCFGSNTYGQLGSGYPVLDNPTLSNVLPFQPNWTSQPTTMFPTKRPTKLPTARPTKRTKAPRTSRSPTLKPSRLRSQG